MTAKMMSQEERAAKVAALKPAWAKDYILQLEDLTRKLADQLRNAQAQGAADLEPDGEVSEARDRIADRPPVYPEGTSQPDGREAPIQVVDGSAGMEPVIDLAETSEVRFAGFFQVHATSRDGGVLLVVEGEGPLALIPVDPGTVVIRKA
jgi:hypothetical protein